MPALFDGKPELPAFGVPAIVGGVAVLLALEVPPADELLAAEEDDMVVPEAPGVVGSWVLQVNVAIPQCKARVSSSLRKRRE